MAEMNEPDRAAGYRIGSKDDFLRFYRDAVGPVYRSASRLVGADRARCDDLVQDAFLALIAEVRAGRITHVDVGWMIVAVRNRFIDSLRRSAREERRLRLVWSGARSQPTESADGDGDETLWLVQALPEAQRIAVVLHHVEQLSVKEIADAMGKTPHAVESLLARGRKSLRRLIEGVQL